LEQAVESEGSHRDLTTIDSILHTVIVHLAINVEKHNRFGEENLHQM
jgi:hypothetical protein